MPRLFLVDTNVVVSGVLTFGRAGARSSQASAPSSVASGSTSLPSAPSLILRAMLDGRLSFVVSADLLAEYRLALLRPAIAARHRREPWSVGILLAELATAAHLRQLPDALVSDPDDRPPRCAPGDEHVIRLMVHEPRAALVSWDGRLIDAVRGWREVLKPGELVEAEGLGASPDDA